MSTPASEGFLQIGACRLEYRMIGPPPHQAATIVLLHEGLGSVALWGDFPDRLAAATGTGVFVYSRAGYGRSSGVPLPRPLTYMHDEALDVLPRLLNAIDLRRGILLGHSDGASIATIYAGSTQDHRLRGLVLMAPHFFVEDVSIASIAEARRSYEQGDLRAKLSRWHENVDVAFRGWNDAWLDPGFRTWDITEALAYIRLPILIIQGEDDEYGTPRQIETAREECYCPLETTLLPGVRHAPHRDAPDTMLRHVSDFAGRLLGDAAERGSALVGR